jgi:hypothetical protein
MSGDLIVLHSRFGDVAARLLDGRAQPDPPADWACWSVPAPALPIDDVVARLIGRNADPRLRSPAELQKRDIPLTSTIRRSPMAGTCGRTPTKPLKVFAGRSRLTYVNQAKDGYGL